MKTVYVVQFTTGEYEDRKVTIVRVYESEEKAQEYCNAFNLALLKAGLHWEQEQGHWGIKQFTFEDQTFSVDYTGSRLDYIPVPIY